MQQPIVAQPLTQRSTTLGLDRSVINAAGGIVAIGGPTQMEKLPAETGIVFLNSCFFPFPFMFLVSNLLTTFFSDIIRP